MDLDWLVARPIAHRGLHARERRIVENTESAFAAAISGNYAIECDLQITADGEAVVFHDETLERLTLAQGWVNQHTVKQLRAIPIKDSTDRMQTLAELLAQVQGTVPLVIELKTHWDGGTALAARALEVLQGYAGQYAVMSFDPDLVAAMAELSPNTVRGITADRATDAYYDILPDARRDSLRRFDHLRHTKPHFASFYFRDLPFEPVQKFRDEGHPVITWTIRNAEEERRARLHSDQVTFEGYAA
jgi:glycerophosphoryl diester phosphodiesterase